MFYHIRSLKVILLKMFINTDRLSDQLINLKDITVLHIYKSNLSFQLTSTNHCPDSFNLKILQQFFHAHFLAV